MMRFKKAILFLLCAVLALPLLACNKDTHGDGDSGKKYKVTFYVGADAAAAGVTVTPTSIEVRSGSSYGDTLPVPTAWSGYVFQRWLAPGGTQFTSSTKVSGDITVTAEWKTEAEVNAEAAAYEQSLTAANGWLPGHLYIHYKRYGHSTADQGKENTGAPEYKNPIGSTEYDNWGLWAWPKNDEGRLFYPWRIDASGEVFDILLDHTYNDAGWDNKNKVQKTMEINYRNNHGNRVSVIGMQLIDIKSRTTGTGFWANDGGDNDLYLSSIAREDGTYHWFVTQGNVTDGSSKFSNETLVDPYDGLATGSQTTRTAVGNGIINSNAAGSYPKVSSRVQGWDEDSVGYQIFIASFCDSDGDGMGDLRGIINQLPYLKSLNVDVLWLTPFQSSTNYHGYDIKDYYSVDRRFGTLADYRELVYKVHENGMKIVMDFVLNHTSKSNPWFVKSQNLVKETVTYRDGTTAEVDYRQFYTWINKAQYTALPVKQRDGLGENHDGQQWFGPLNGNGSADDGYYFYSSFSSDMPELNYDYQPVRDAILDVCDYWMSFGLDGFRLDAVKHIYMQNEVKSVGKTLSSNIAVDTDDSYNHDVTRNLNFYNEFNYRLKTMHPNAFVVGENLDGNPNNVAPYYAGIDSQFNFNLYYDAARKIAQMSGIKFNGGETTNAGWASGFMKSDASDGYVINDNKYRAVNPNFIDGQFTSNHDLPRARDRVNIKNTITGEGKIDDEYAAFYTDGTMDGSKGGSVDTAAVTKTDALLRMYYAFQFTIPGITWIYYGDELGMSGIMQFTLDEGSTSSTASTPHEDRIYRQPMKWYTTETAENKNGKYDIGYNNFVLQLTGINATEYVQGVDMQSAPSNTGSMLNWVKKLTAIRDTYGLGKAQVKNGAGANGMEYTVQGSKGSIRVRIGTDTYSAGGKTVLAQFDSGNYHVLITEA